MKRRTFITALAALAAAPITAASASQLKLSVGTDTPVKPAFIAQKYNKKAPSALTIEKSLKAPPKVKIKPSMKGSIKDVKRRKALRHIAPSIEIQAINFAFGSPRIHSSQHWKVEQIAMAMHNMLGNNPNEVFLIEGHTDAVGSFESNQYLSERRAYSLYRVLSEYFGVPDHALETVGYGEDDLLVPTPHADWRNRRVTLRRITDIIYQ
ncbi:OmpA family protein [Hoeflea prorocentri]|uniref:OmpA family protein n=1 Tax=Hoeflea prorocentri TaxID=1922333 RepID=A0A9X3ZH44_9HYPH|nr:OmpA family protein [Hoeflea prorocentri]MCY6380548.1 OmpA family protein [Hoeflea prorocentri]MDA5398348.1 OmpA family protein [Hoeflea prorocentri]